MNQFLDIFYSVLHITVILFNLFGWAWKKTLKANLVLLLLTGSSWFILGIWYGIGYCPLTDWHWKTLKELGHNNLPNSYVTFLLERTTGILLDPGTADGIVVVAYFISLSISIYQNLKK